MNIEKHIQDQIDALEIKLADITLEEFDQSRVDRERFHLLFGKGLQALTEAELEEFKNLNTGPIGNLELLENLRETLASNLLEVKTKYLVSSCERLRSPAGFHPDTKVFVQPTIAIQVDDIDAFEAPSCNVTLYVHNLDRN